MRELKGNWKDLLSVFRASIGISKLALSALAIFFVLCTSGLITLFLGAASETMTFSNYISEIGYAPDNALRIICSVVYLPLVAVPDAWTYSGSLWKAIMKGIWLIASLGFIVVFWSYFGAAISRMAALEFTKDEKIGVGEAFSYATEKWGSNCMSFGLPVLGFGFFWAVVWIVAHFANIPGFDVLLMIVLPLALIGGVIMAFILFGFAFGFPLFTPSLSVEGTDSFDAFSRGFSYVMSKPREYAGYWVFTILYGALGTAFVWFFAEIAFHSMNSAGTMVFGFGDSFSSIVNMEVMASGSSAGTTVYAAALVYYVWMFFFELFAAAFPVSFFFTASTMIYLLMRKHVDGIEMEEIFEDLSEEDELLFDEEVPDFEEDLEETEEEEEEDEDQDQEEATDTSDEEVPEEEEDDEDEDEQEEEKASDDSDDQEDRNEDDEDKDQ